MSGVRACGHVRFSTQLCMQHSRPSGDKHRPRPNQPNVRRARAICHTNYANEPPAPHARFGARFGLPPPPPCAFARMQRNSVVSRAERVNYAQSRRQTVTMHVTMCDGRRMCVCRCGAALRRTGESNQCCWLLGGCLAIGVSVFWSLFSFLPLLGGSHTNIAHTHTSHAHSRTSFALGHIFEL